MFKYNLYILILIIMMVYFCKKVDPTQPQKGKKVAILCENQKAIRFHYDPESGSVTEKGPVELPKGIDCKKAQDMEEKEIIKLKREGKWVQYYKDSTNILAEGENKENKREGEWRFYDQKGNLTKTVIYKQGKKEGKEITYFSGTKIVKSEGININDNKEGEWIFYSDPTHQCISKGEYKENNREGEWVECSEDPETKKWYISFKGKYFKDLKDGPVENYFPNGNISSKGRYRADLKCKENPPPEGVEMCAKKIGEWIFYFSNGNIMEQGSYDAQTGKRSGFWKEYYASGQLRAQGNRNHTRTGRWTFYDKEGKILGQFDFKGNDFMANYCVEFKNEKKVAEGPCTAKMIKYEPEKDAFKFSDGMKQGLWKGYHPNGNLAWEGELIMNKRQGLWKIYDESGKLVQEGSYNMDKKNGYWKEWVDGKFVTREYDQFGRLKN